MSTLQDKNNDSVIYATGCTPSGVTLIGGVWKLWEQEGFPLELSHLTCQQNGWAVDWLEAMADASLTNNLPALMKHVEVFLPDITVVKLQAGFVCVLQSGKPPEQVVAEKRANGRAFSEFMRAAETSLIANEHSV